MNRNSVLIVDDEPDIRELLGMTMDEMGLNTVCAENVESAKKALSNQPFDFCLTDMRMPDGSGLDLIVYIQKFHPK